MLTVVSPRFLKPLCVCVLPPALLLLDFKSVDLQGQAIIPSGLAWQQHMLVLIVSAKLLADAEAALQMTPESGTAGMMLIFLQSSFKHPSQR